MGNAIIPIRASEDPAIPVRWRTYLRLQLLGAALDWTPIRPVDLAAHFEVHPQTVYRALQWLVKTGYVEKRVIRGHHGGRPHAYRVVIDEHPSAA